MPPIGSPGISRGSRKFSVSATHMAKRVEDESAKEPAHGACVVLSIAAGRDRSPARRAAEARVTRRPCRRGRCG